MELKPRHVLVEQDAVTKLLEVAAERWISNPELVIDEVRRFAGKIIPSHPLIQAKTLRAEKEARTKFVVVEREKLQEMYEVVDANTFSESAISCGIARGRLRCVYKELDNLLKEDR
jgi:hypothetical protein